MATIYELTGQWNELYAMADDPEMDAETWFDTMEGLEGEIEVKADGYAKVIKQLKADAEAVKAEKDRLANKQKALENKAQYLMQRLQMSMEMVQKDKIKTDLFSFTIQNNPPTIVMDEQYIENIPKEYLKYAEPTIDKAKLKDHLRAGADLSGICHLEQTRGLRIR